LSAPVRDLSLSFVPPAARMVCEPASDAAKSRIVLDQVAACGRRFLAKSQVLHSCS